MLYQKYTVTLTRRTSHHHFLNWLLRSIPKRPVSLDCMLLKDSVSAACWISLDYSCETYPGHLSETRILGGSSHDGLRQSAAVLVSAVCHNWDCQDSIRYWKDRVGFGQTPVSERLRFTLLYFLYFQRCLLVILENLKCDAVSHDCFFRHLAKYTYVYNSYFWHYQMFTYIQSVYGDYKHVK